MSDESHAQRDAVLDAAPTTTTENEPPSDVDLREAASPSGLPFPVVGLGASAGGLEALERFFTAMPNQSALAFVVVQHLSPDHKSLMPELLSRHTRMRVVSAQDGEAVEPNCVYTIPPGKTLKLGGDGRLHLANKEPGGGLHLPIDLFLRSLAEAQGERSAAIVLSGTGSDGMHGIRAVKQAGGLVLVQDAQTAQFDGMPRSAAATGLADFVTAPDRMPEHLMRCLSNVQSPGESPAVSDLDVRGDDYAQIMAELRRETGADFEHYKSTTVLRRLERRMSVTRTTTLGSYLAFLRNTPSETHALFQDLLIGVTKFFRDAAVWDRIRELAVRPLVESAKPGQPLRIWVPGCSTGEEAYSYAMLFADEIARSHRALEFKVFATDIDREAVEFGGQAIYPPSSAPDIPRDLFTRHMTPHKDGFAVSRALRKTVLFAVHDLTHDPPFTKIDLASCRNLLIYLEPILQQRVLGLLHFSLRPGGRLILGTSETVGDLVDQFRPIDTRGKIYSMAGASRLPVPELRFRGPIGVTARAADQVRVRGDMARVVDRLAESIIREFAPATLVLDDQLELVHTFGDASAFLKVPTGGATLDIRRMTAPPLSTLLASAVPRALRTHSETTYTDLVVDTPQGKQSIEVRVRCVESQGQNDAKSLVVVMIDRHAAKDVAAPQGELVRVSEQSERELAELQKELQHSKESLQAMVEELETSNEELQATNEELLASNEELQSTNEELQSVNEELHTVNSEYERKVAELSELINDTENLLRCTDVGTIFLDARLHVRKFTPRATAYVNLLDRDVGRPLDHLALGFGDGDVLGAVRKVIAGGPVVEMTHDARDGRHVLVRVLPYVVPPAVTPSGAVITLVDVTRLRHAQERTQSLLDSLPDETALLDADGKIIMTNALWRTFADAHAKATMVNAKIGENYLDACDGASTGEMVSGAVYNGVGRVLRREQGSFDVEYRASVDGASRWFRMYVSGVEHESGAVISHADITRKKLAEAVCKGCNAYVGGAAFEPTAPLGVAGALSDEAL